jgi:hypothetical protein
MTAAQLHRKISRIALALPHATELVSHGSPAWRVADKRMFAYFWHNHHGDGITALLVKTSGLDEQTMLIEMDPDLYFKPAYVGPSGWVGLRLDQGPPDWDNVADKLEQSWRLAAPKRLLA